MKSSNTSFVIAFFLTFALFVTSASAGPANSAVDPADWGPAYVAGIEAGPASENLSEAFRTAEKFMARQPFAKQYAKRACSGSWSPEHADVGFALLSDKTGTTRGVVRVDPNTNKCIWLGQPQQK